jgi:hypothetical protein
MPLLPAANTGKIPAATQFSTATQKVLLVESF